MKTWFLCSLLIFVTACTPSAPHPLRSQLEVREFQTRTFDTQNSDDVLKAIIDALHDDGYVVRNADRGLGFVSAYKQVDPETPLWFKILSGSEGRYLTSLELEASLHVTGKGKQTRVRAVFISKELDNFGASMGAQNVDDVKFYQDFFAKVDKSFYYMKNNL